MTFLEACFHAGWAERMGRHRPRGECLRQLTGSTGGPAMTDEIEEIHLERVEE